MLGEMLFLPLCSELCLGYILTCGLQCKAVDGFQSSPFICRFNRQLSF